MILCFVRESEKSKVTCAVDRDTVRGYEQTDRIQLINTLQSNPMVVRNDSISGREAIDHRH